MREPRRARWLVAAVLVAALSACTGTPSDPPTSAPPTATQAPAEPTTSPSSSPSATLTDSEAAAANAEALVRNYWSALDRVGSDPSLPLETLEEVAVSKDLTVRMNQFTTWRRDGWVQSGSTELAELQVQSVNLDTSGGRVPTVQVDVCFDVTGVDVVDGSGSSVVTAERPDTGWIRHTVSNYSWESDPSGGWRVSTSVDLEQAPCEPTV
jgi:hypothetical protein